jgi:hypothetical protein
MAELTQILSSVYNNKERRNTLMGWDTVMQAVSDLMAAGVSGYDIANGIVLAGALALAAAASGVI